MKQTFDFDNVKNGDRIILQGEIIEWKKQRKEYGCSGCALDKYNKNCLPCEGGIWKDQKK